MLGKIRRGFESGRKEGKKEKKARKENRMEEEISKVNGGTGKGSYQETTACASHGSSSLHLTWKKTSHFFFIK